MKICELSMLILLVSLIFCNRFGCGLVMSMLLEMIVMLCLNCGKVFVI